MRNQYSVGHGGFHATVIPASIIHDSLVYVYDVGARPKVARVKSSVDALINDLKNQKIGKIDYIFISHIDEDHVNGLKYLLAECGKIPISIGKVILPWLSPLVQLLRRHMGSRGVAQKILSNPLVVHGFDSNVEIEEIVVLMPENMDNLSGENNLFTPGLTTGQGVQLGVTRSGGTLPHKGPKNWVLAPYTDALDPSREALFYDKIRRKTNIEPTDVSNHEKLIRNHQKAIRDSISELSASNIRGNYAGTLSNWSSMSLLAGANPKRHPGGHVISNDIDLHLASDCMWLHTGDAPLDDLAYYGRYSQWLTKYQSQVCCFSVPHHGSLMGHLPNAYADICPSNALVFSGYLSSGAKVHRLPAKDVEDFLLRARLGQRPMQSSFLRNV